MPDSKTSGTDARDSARLRPGAVALGIVLVPLTCYWVIYAEGVKRAPFFSTVALYANAIFILAALVVLNRLVLRRFPKFALSQGELLICYFSVVLATAISGMMMVPVLVEMMAHATQYATPENGWAATFVPHMPHWLVVTDPNAVKEFYYGNSSLYTASHLRAWTAPALSWSAFLVVLIYVLVCINNLVRMQWDERERLAFPMVQIPLAMTEPDAGLWRNRLMWLGFAIAASIDIYNGMAMIYPSLPTIQTKPVIISDAFTTKPWNSMGLVTTSFFPFVIGLGFLLPTDLSFSCWFFYLFSKAQMVTGSMLGLDALPQFPFQRQQAFGAYAALFAVMAWTGREHLRRIWRSVIGLSAAEDKSEAFSYRWSAIGAFAGTVVLTLFFAQMGLPLWLGAALFAVYFVLATAVARVRAEIGPPSNDLYGASPDGLAADVGAAHLSPAALTAMNFFLWFNRGYVGHPATTGVDMLKAASQTRSNRRVFAIAFLVAGGIAAISSFWSFLHIAYKLGAAGGMPQYGIYFGAEACNRADTWIRTPAGLPGHQIVATIAGFVFCALLGLARARYVGWPFHPAGFALSSDWSMNSFWMPLMIAWALKVAILKMGGIKFYHRAVPFFLGLALGEMIIGGLWSLVGIVFGLPTYTFC